MATSKASTPKTATNSPGPHRLRSDFLKELELQRKEEAARDKMERLLHAQALKETAKKDSAELALRKISLRNEKERDLADIFLKKLALKEAAVRGARESKVNKATLAELRKVESSKATQPPHITILLQRAEAPKIHNETHPSISEDQGRFKTRRETIPLSLQLRDQKAQTPEKNELFLSHRLASVAAGLEPNESKKKVFKTSSDESAPSYSLRSDHDIIGQKDKQLRLVQSVSFDKEGRTVSVTKKVPRAATHIYILDKEGGLHPARKGNRLSRSKDPRQARSVKGTTSRR